MKWLAALLMLLCFRAGAADSSSADDRRQLHDLLEERNKRFEHYLNSLDRKSGIFGNKTKGDLKASQAVLAEIVETDNKIIRTLNRVVDFRNFEKATMNYDLRERDVRLDDLMQSLDKLAKKSESLEERNNKLERQLSIRTIFIYVLAVAAVLLFFTGRRTA